MAAGEITISRKLITMGVGINEDAFHCCPSLAGKNFRHAMRRLAKRNACHTAERTQIVEVIAHAQYAALVVHVPLKSLFNTGFRQCPQKYLPRSGTHAVGDRHQLVSACLPGLKYFVIQSWMAACISDRCPSKKWSPPSTITISLGSGAESKTFLRLS